MSFIGHGEYLADASSGVATIETVSAAGSRDHILLTLGMIFLLMRIYASDDIYCIHVQYNCHFLCKVLPFLFFFCVLWPQKVSGPSIFYYIYLKISIKQRRTV